MILSACARCCALGLRNAIAFAFFLILAVAMTWPLARDVAGVVAYPGDPFINTWILDWDYYATFVAHAPLFDANIFYPSRLTLALSEHLFGLALIAAPLRAAGVSPLAAHNILHLLGFAVCGFGAYLLASHATRSRGAGLVAGIAYAYMPWRFTHLPHLQHAWTAPLALLLLALLKYAEKQTALRASAIGLALLATGAINLHAFAFGAFTTVATVALLLAFRREARNARWVAPIAISCALACALLLPLLLPYRTAMSEYGFRGDPQETLNYSARPSDWLLTNFHNRFYLPVGTNRATTDPERWLFPGLGIVFLSVTGLLHAAPRRLLAAALVLLTLLFAAATVRLDAPGWLPLSLLILFLITLAVGLFWPATAMSEETRAIALLWIAIGFAGSLGLTFWFHQLLFDSLSIFRGIRAPARWAMVAHVGLALAAAFGASELLRNRVRSMRILLTAVMCSALVIELRSAPIQYVAAPETPAVYRWLATDRANAVLELPIGDAQVEYQTMLHATVHRKRRVNGISGFTPQSFEDIAREFRGIAAATDLTNRLAKIGVDTIVVHEAWLGAQANAVRAFVSREVAAGRLVLERRFESDAVYRVRPARASSAP